MQPVHAWEFRDEPAGRQQQLLNKYTKLLQKQTVLPTIASIPQPIQYDLPSTSDRRTHTSKKIIKKEPEVGVCEIVSYTAIKAKFKTLNGTCSCRLVVYPRQRSDKSEVRN